MRMRNTLIALLAASAAAVLGMSLADRADAGTVRIEYSRNGVVYGSETITTSGTSIQSAGAPNMGGLGGKAEVTVISGAVVLTQGSATATESNGVRRQTTEHQTFSVNIGEKLAFIDSADAATFGGGGGGGGGGDASAANQATQITAAQLTNTTLGAVTASPTANTIGDRLKTLNTSVGTVNTSLGTVNTTLGSPMQNSGGTVGISGTLPAFGTTPTFNLGTLNGAATAANQTSTQATMAAASAPTNGQGQLLQYSATPPALTTGQTVSQQGNKQGDLFAAHPRDVTATWSCSATCSTTNSGVLWTSATAYPSVGDLPYDLISIQTTSAGTGVTLILEGSNDGTNWVTLNNQVTGTTTTTFSTSVVTTTTSLSTRQIPTPFIRLRASAYTSGTTSGVVALRAVGQSIPVSSVTLAAGSNAVGSLTAGTAVIGQVNEAGNSFTNVTTNTTTTMKSGAGILHACTINTKGASANTATLYDNSAGSGTKIATIDTTDSTRLFVFDLTFSTGLTVVTATGTPADFTCTWR